MKKNLFYVLLAYTLWGLFPIFWKQLSAVSPIYVLATRLVWSLVFCLLLAVLRRSTGVLRELLKNKRLVGRLTLCGITITLNWGLYIAAVSAGHIIEGSLAYFMCPIFSVLMGCIFYREKLDKLQWIAVALATLGVLIPVLRYGKVPVYALGIGLSFAVYSALKKKITLKSELSMVMETLPLVPFALLYIVWQETHGGGCSAVLSGWQYLLLPLSGVFTSVPLLLFARGVPHMPLSLSGVVMYLNPVLQLMVGVIIYHEEFTVTNAITFGFVLAAVLLFFARQWLHRSKPLPVAAED